MSIRDIIYKRYWWSIKQFHFGVRAGSCANRCKQAVSDGEGAELQEINKALYLTCVIIRIKMFQMGNSVFCCSNAGGSGSGSLTARHRPTHRTCVWGHFILNPIMSIANIAMMFKKKRAPWNHLKRRIQRSPWQNMKQHTKYKDPVRNYGTLSFYQIIVITSIHFTILPLAFYLD